MPFIKGYIMSKEHKRKIGDANLGRRHSIESKNNMSEASKGQIPWNKGKTGLQVAWNRRGWFKKCSVCTKEFWVRPSCDDQKCCSHTCRNENRLGKYGGEKHWNWRGGINDINDTIRKSNLYKKWRLAVFQRDNYTCTKCSVRGSNLHADHIKPFSTYPNLRFDVNNGRTLCKSCHRRTPTWGAKALKFSNPTAVE